MLESIVIFTMFLLTPGAPTKVGEYRTEGECNSALRENKDSYKGSANNFICLKTPVIVIPPKEYTHALVLESTTKETEGNSVVIEKYNSVSECDRHKYSSKTSKTYCVKIH